MASVSSYAITERPEGWSCVLQPVLYKILRKDDTNVVTIDTTGGSDGTFRVIVPSGHIHEVGDSIMFHFIDTVEGSRYIFATITSIVDVAGDDGLVTDHLYSGFPTVDVNTYINNFTQRSGFSFQVRIYDALTNLALFEDDLTFTPSARGLCTIDLQLLKTLMRPEIELLDLNESAIDTDRFKYFYIKYTPTWNGSDESEVDDVANQRITSWTGLPIKSGMTANSIFNVSPIWSVLPLVAGGWLTLFDRLTLFAERYFDLAYYALVPTPRFLIRRYIEGVLDDESAVTATGYLSRIRIHRTGSEDQIQIAPLASESVILAPNVGWSDLSLPTQPFDSKTATSLVGNVDGSGPTPNKGAAQLMTMPVPLPSVEFDYEVDVTGTIDPGSTFLIRIQITTSLGVVLYTYDSPVFAGSDFPGPVEDTADLQPIASGTPAALVLYLLPQTTDLSDNFDVEIILPVGEALSFTAIESAVKIIDVVEPCEPSIHLGWMNEMGGQDWWSFQHNQDESLAFNDNERANRASLYVDALSANEFRVLNGLNTAREAYRSVVSEISETVFTNKKRIGQQVYDATDEDAVRGVIVLPRSNQNRTRNVKRPITIEIEYPDDSVQ